MPQVGIPTEDALDELVPRSLLGAPAGVAQLGEDGKLLPGQTPAAPAPPVTSVNGEVGDVELGDSAATPGTLALRDSAGRLKVANPSASGDAATKFTVDSAIITARQRPINAQTAAMTLTLADAGRYVSLNSASPLAVTLPAEADVAFPNGTVIDVAQTGPGAVTITPAAGVSITSLTGTLVTAGQYAIVRLIKTGTNLWRASGDLVVPAKARAFLRQSITQTGMGNGVWTSISFTTEDVDTHDGHNNNINPTRWTCPAGQAGLYQITGGVTFAVTGTYRLLARLMKNGALIPGTMGGGSVPAVVGDTAQAFPALVPLAAGDYVELQGFANVASWGTGVFSDDQSSMSVVRLD